MFIQIADIPEGHPHEAASIIWHLPHKCKCNCLSLIFFLQKLPGPFHPFLHFPGPSTCTSCCFFEFLLYFLLFSITYWIQQVRKLPGDAGVVMLFHTPPIISKCGSSIKPEFRLLSPHFVLFWKNTVSVTEDCSSDIQLFSLFPAFSCFYGRIKDCTEFRCIHQMVGRNSGKTCSAITPWWPRRSLEMSALRDQRSALLWQ